MVEDFDCGENAPVRVQVGDTEIPVINDGLRTELRKYETLSFSRFSEVYFPAVFPYPDGEPYYEVVSAVDPARRNVYDPVDIYIRDYHRDDYVLVHRGFVMGVSPGAKGENELRMTVGDVSQLLGAIPFDKEYNRGTDIGKILEDVMGELEDRLVPDVFDEIVIDDQRDTDVEVQESNFIIGAGERLQDATGFDLEGDTLVRIGEGVGVAIDEGVGGSLGSILDAQKTFSENEHTAANAMEYVMDLAEDYVFYFAPHGSNSIRLVIDGNPHDDHYADHMDTDSDNIAHIYKNNALHEIKPVNAIYGTGKVDDGEYPQVALGHKGLIKRSSQVFPINRGPDTIDTADLDGAIEQARAELKKELDDSGLGDIRSAPAPRITPYSLLTSTPYSLLTSKLTCAPAVENEIDPFTWEVETVVHYISAQRSTDRWDRRLHETQLEVSIPTTEESIVPLMDIPMLTVPLDRMTQYRETEEQYISSQQERGTVLSDFEQRVAEGTADRFGQARDGLTDAARDGWDWLTG